MTGLHFAEPQWIHLLWLVLAFVALLIGLERRGANALERFVGLPLQSRLLAGLSGGQRTARIVFLGLTGVFLTLALMRPQWGLEIVESRRAGAEIMICLDVSKSMLAEDVAPNRLERAKAEIRDLLAMLDGDQVGLIAFAGRASVLSPLTPDFGFLRLALDEASPTSVTRGGTRLEEPIRKAIEGFGDAGEVSRSILLITDGEDHDSFPLEAAKDAAERGIRILAIGFGAETGAEILVTDPETGARTTLKDADGAVVRSRLDGDLLREMALATSGAYVPAGTGVLDLESIYQRHIAPLTRGRLDGSARAVRNDAFQWAVLLALLALLGAVMSTARGRGWSRGRDAGIGLFLLGLSAAMTAMPPAIAQQTTADPAVATDGDGTSRETVPEVEADGEQTAEETTGEAVDPVPEDPRAAYNEGIAKLDTEDTEAAARLLEAARTQAGTDAEVRFRATYNLGWVEVRAADALLEAAPTEALERLYRAAGWFREALELRPGNDDARYNLEIVMRRALELADSLADRDEGKLGDRLDALIEAQRGFLGMLREGIAQQQNLDDANVTADLRRQFRDLAARELTVLADAEQLSERAAREREGLRSKPDQERSSEEALRAASLEGVVSHLHRARERIGQTRTRLRRLQGERAYRRASAALGSLRRARDQLLDPVARLDALLADGAEIAQLTGVKVALERGLDDPSSPTPAPDWLTPKYLTEAQIRIESRTGELHEGLASGLSAQDPASTVEGGGPEQTAAAEQARVIERLREATPLIGEAHGHFESASSALSSARWYDTLDAQRKALEALTTAREQLFGLRRLIERVYGDERQVAGLIAEPSADPSTEDDSNTNETGATSSLPSSDAEIWPEDEAVALAASLHARNVERTRRLDRMISDAMVDALAPDEAGASSVSGATAASPGEGEQRQRLEQAHELLLQAQDAMNAAQRTFQEVIDTTASVPASSALQSTRTSVDQALVQLEALRRLFFSVLEHLQDAARRQQELADETEALAALDPGSNAEATARQVGPIGHRQGNLAATTEGIGEALRAQASTSTAQPAPPDGRGEGSDRERLTQAAELITGAGVTMNRAAERLADSPPLLDQARSAQDQALNGLLEAIALLQQQDQAGSQDGDQSQSESGDQAEQQPEPEPEQQTDLGQLLQSVRDREAQRREDRARNRARQQGYEPVEKDW